MSSDWTIEKDINSVAEWLREHFHGRQSETPLWVELAHDLIAANTGTGAISVHFVAKPYAEDVQQAIRKDFTDDQLEDITSFSELHRQCDANVYLIDHGPAIDDDHSEVSLNLINAITDIVDEWLRTKGWQPAISEGMFLGCNTFDYFELDEDKHKEVARVRRDHYEALIVTGRPATGDLTATAEGYTVMWTDFVANHWGEHYTTLPTALARLAILEQAVVEEQVMYQDPPEFAKTAQKLLIDAQKEAHE